MARRAASHSHAILAGSGAGAEWGDSLERGRDGGPDRAADHLVEDALVGPDRRAEQSEVAWRSTAMCMAAWFRSQSAVLREL